MKTAFKKFIPWIVLVLLVGGLVAWYVISNRVSEDENARYDTKISEAQKWYDGKEYSTAMTTYYQAAELIPSRVEAFQGIIQILLDKNKMDEALSILDGSAQKLSLYDQSTLYAILCERYLDDGDDTKALETCEKGQGLGEVNQNLEIALGKAYLRNGDVGSASEILKKDIYDGDNLSEATLLLSYIQSLSDTATAKATLGRISPSDNWKIYFEEFSDVLGSLDSDTKYNAAKLARIFINNGYSDLAVSVLAPIESEISEYVEGIYFLGRAYLEVGDYDKALGTLNKAVSLGNMEDDIFWTMARVYVLKNDLNSAQDCYSKALGYQGSTPSEELISEYLDILISNNQTLKADEVLQMALGKVKATYLYEYGVKINNILKETEKVNYYIELLGGLTLNDEEKKEYLYLKARAMLDQNVNISDIVNVLDELLALDRFNPEYYYLLGRLEFEQGNAESAKQALNKAIEYDLNYKITEDSMKLLSNIE
jgi:tetratricopeptide (TPR) repeat protein